MCVFEGQHARVLIDAVRNEMNTEKATRQIRTMSLMSGNEHRPCVKMFLLVFKVSSQDFEEVDIDETVSLCVCPSQRIPSNTIAVIIIKLGTVTASDMKKHHVLIILILTSIQGHTDLNHENNNVRLFQKLDKGREIRCWLKAARQRAVASLRRNPWDFYPP